MIMIDGPGMKRKWAFERHTNSELITIESPDTFNLTLQINTVQKLNTKYNINKDTIYLMKTTQTNVSALLPFK